MSKDIKPGDLVMVVRPSICCSDSQYLGNIFTVSDVERAFGRCTSCGSIQMRFDAKVKGSFDDWFDVRCLIKIDPPSEGDSLPTRADMKLGAGDTVKS